MERFASSFRVILDANVLFSAPLRDLLVRCAARRLYRVHWSATILEEMRRNLVGTGRVSEEKSHVLVEKLRETVPEAEVTGHEELIDCMRNDPKDRHVVAAAVACRAGVIVTLNIRDSDQSKLPPFVKAKTPDEFLHDLADLAPEKVTAILQEQASALKRPPLSLDELLAKLAAVAPRFVETYRRGLRGAEEEELHEARKPPASH